MARFLLKRMMPVSAGKRNKTNTVMAISVKSKFAGFLRGLLRQMDDRDLARPVASAAPLPAPVAPAASTPALDSSAALPAASADEIELPLTSVLAALPLDLRAKLVATPPAGLTIRLQAETVISQLAFGAVKISFGELRQLAPGVFVNCGGEPDHKLVSLPLHEILPRINPVLLARRAVKKVEVAAEISGPFAERGRGFSFTTQPLKAPATPPLAPAPATPAPFVSSAAPRQMAPPPMAPQFPPRSITPSTPTNGGHGSNGNGHGMAVPPGLRFASMN